MAELMHEDERLEPLVAVDRHVDRFVSDYVEATGARAPVLLEQPGVGVVPAARVVADLDVAELVLSVGRVKEEPRRAFPRRPPLVQPRRGRVVPDRKHEIEPAAD